MAPSLTVSSSEITSQSLKSTVAQITRSTGQIDPIYSLLSPYSSFPQKITGPTVWSAADYSSNPERWTHVWSPSQIEAISNTADGFLSESYGLTSITKELFQLPDILVSFLESVRQEILNGKGFILFKGFPVQEWGIKKSAVAYMGIGAYFGYFVSQNSRGHVLGHVKDLGEDSTQIDKVRIYRTNARQFFHTDDCDLVGLLCIARALEGGESDLVSSHHIFNVLQRKRPDIVELLTKPIWYFDRKGETSKGQKEWIRAPVFYWYEGRLYTKWDPYYVQSLTRFSKIGAVPPLSEKQVEALDILEQTCLEESLHMILEVGDIQFLSNSHTLHARTAYVDHPAPEPRRQLMRLWLSTPETEGGWKLPFPDSKEAKRGGIQVDDTKEICPLDAE
ncbi:hypothetical protein EDC01DRAFT_101599 [Geopyxis carbonaria]|nr:hypothetical protein EDC01DRAFT_101599 [Geopyxis carbonaria]